MKKAITQRIVLAFIIITFSTRAQQIPFPRNQHQDSIALAKHIPALALKVIPLLKDPNNPDLKDLLFRVQLVAKNYKVVAPLLRELGQESYGDSTKIRALGIAFRWYANIMTTPPKDKKAFEQAFEKQFQKLNALATAKNNNVYRNGELINMSVNDLLVGDIVEI